MNTRFVTRLRGLARMPWAWAIGFAIVAYGLHLLLYPIGDPDYDTDFYGDLVVGAKRLSRGEIDVRNYPYKGPLFSFVLVAVQTVVRNWYFAGVLVNALAAAGCLIVLYRLLRSLYTPAVAASCVVVLSFVPTFFAQAHSTNTDMLFLLFVLASLASLVKVETGLRAVALAGWWAGLAFLTRPLGAVLAMAALPSLLLFAPATWSWRSRLRSTAIYLAALLAVAGPWLVLSQVQTGTPFYTRNTQNIEAGLFDRVRWASLSEKAAQRSLWEIVSYDPAHVAQQLVKNWREHLRKDFAELLGVPLLVLPVLGFAAFVFRPPTRAAWRFYLFGILYFIALGPIFYSPRFSLPLLPAYLAGGLAVFGRWAGPRLADETSASRLRRRVVQIVALAFVLGGVVVGAVMIYRAERERMERRPVDLWPGIAALKAHVATHGTGPLLGRKGLVALHAGVDYVPYPRATGFSLRDLLQYAERHSVRYISYGRLEFELTPDLRFLSLIDSLPGTRDVFRAGADRILEVTNTAADVSELQELDMLAANALIAKRLGNPQLESHACNVIAKYYMDRGRPAESLPWLQVAVKVVAGAQPGTPEGRAAITGRSNLAAVLLYLQRPAEARPHLEQVMAYFEQYGSRDDRGNTMILLAAADELEERIPAAKARLQYARQLFAAPADQARVDSMLVQMERQAGSTSPAER